jgi:hypothetical protein
MVAGDDKKSVIRTREYNERLPAVYLSARLEAENWKFRHRCLSSCACLSENFEINARPAYRLIWPAGFREVE